MAEELKAVFAELRFADGTQVIIERGGGQSIDAILGNLRAAATGTPPSMRDDGVIEALRADNERLTKLLSTPEVENFAKGVVFEAAYQRERWGAEHDAGKTPFDWFWLVGYLAQKAAASAVAGNNEKALHHTISTAAALANWHLALSGTDTRMVPGAPLPMIAEGDVALSSTAKGER
jgi:hypothetical protein